MHTDSVTSWWWLHKPSTDRPKQLDRNEQIELALNPGLYVLSLLAHWHELGDVTYGFLVEVER
jgi:hypothetical protein